MPSAEKRCQRNMVAAECSADRWLAPYLRWFDSFLCYTKFAWFPSWLLTLKSCLRFFFRNHRMGCLERVRRDGLNGAASVLEDISFTTLATWRWRKGKAVCVAVYEAFRTIRLETCMECLKTI